MVNKPKRSLRKPPASARKEADGESIAPSAKGAATKKATGPRKPPGAASASGRRKPPVRQPANVPPPPLSSPPGRGRVRVSPAGRGQGEGLVPRWDAEQRELWFGTTRIKHFPRPARIVGLILASFEELGWPRHLDDPLSAIVGTLEPRRLRGVVEDFNRRLDVPLIRFEMAGTGKGITWRPNS